MRSPLLTLCLLTGCSATGVPIEVPHFAPDDERVEQAGFVQETLRLSRETGETKYTFMAFRIGDVVTLGAMVTGPFDGRVEWDVGGASLALSFPAESPGGETVAELSRAPEGATEVRGQRASFRGTTWINVDLEPGVWMPGESTPVQLTFRPRSGHPVVLPDEGSSYALGFVPR